VATGIRLGNYRWRGSSSKTRIETSWRYWQGYSNHGWRGSSSKTRIETHFNCRSRTVIWHVGEGLPAKQGLKLPVTKQELSHDQVGEGLPAKQGLKPTSQPAFSSSVARCWRGSSSKTRIETGDPARQMIIPARWRGSSSKTRIETRPRTFELRLYLQMLARVFQQNKD